VKHKKRKQRSHPVCIDRWDQLLPEGKPEFAKQLNADQLHI
jgi:hypothetical protein